MSPVPTEQSYLPISFKVFYRYKSAWFSTLSELLTDGRHDTTNNNILSSVKTLYVCQIGTGSIAQIVENNLILIQRMGRQIDTHQVTFFVQTLNIAPTNIRLWHCWRGNLHPVEAAKQRVLCLCLLHLIGLTIPHQRIQPLLSSCILSEIVLPSDSEAVEATTQCQRLEGLTVHITHINTLRKVKDRFIRTVLFTFRDDCLCSRLSHSFDGTQTKANLTMVVHTKLLVTLVDIWSQRGNTHLLTLVHQLRDFRNLVTPTTHDGGHEFRRIVSLQISCLIGHP